MSNKLMKIQFLKQKSLSNIDAEVEWIGEVTVDTQVTMITSYIHREFGNGCPSPYIVPFREVRVVTVDGVDYVLEEAKLSGDQLPTITLRMDADTTRIEEMVKAQDEFRADLASQVRSLKAKLKELREEFDQRPWDS